jgi:hypothetical protein
MQNCLYLSNFSFSSMFIKIFFIQYALYITYRVNAECSFLNIRYTRTRTYPHTHLPTHTHTHTHPPTHPHTQKQINKQTIYRLQ